MFKHKIKAILYYNINLFFNLIGNTLHQNEIIKNYNSD